MGTEYRIISQKALRREPLDALLRSLPRFTGFETRFATYDFRAPSNPGQMPNVSVKLEQDGTVYVCDHGGGLASEIIGALMIHLVDDAAPVQLRLIE